MPTPKLSLVDYDLVRIKNTQIFSLRKKQPAVPSEKVRPTPIFDHALSLGRLNRLPFELRQMIFAYVLDACFKGSRKPNGEWRYLAYHPHGGRHSMRFKRSIPESLENSGDLLLLAYLLWLANDNFFAADL